jgi:GT2 family glycosyltransferase
MKPLIEIIIPSYNNWQYLGPCLQSILLHRTTPGLAHVTVINNGHVDSIPLGVREGNPEVTVITPGENLGWERGLKLGVEKTDAPFIVLMNDDTFVPVSSAGWMYELIQMFADAKVGAVGPSSNCVMGPQNMFLPSAGNHINEVTFLIGFCMMVRREALEKAGGIDDSYPYHGDDLDLSIRLRHAGYKLLNNKVVMIYHHGFKTGQREFGSEWNSVEMTQQTNDWLIKKHGLKVFWECMTGIGGPVLNMLPPDLEGDVCRKFALGEVLELGVGGQKTVEPSTGIDIVPKGQEIPGLVKTISVADIVADVQNTLPVPDCSYDTIIVRHCLEHFVNTRKSLKDWSRVLRPNGRLIIAVPDQDKRQTIPLNYQHVRAFTKEVLKEEMEALAFKTLELIDPQNEISFVGVFEKALVFDVLGNGKSNDIDILSVVA